MAVKRSDEKYLLYGVMVRNTLMVKPEDTQDDIEDGKVIGVPAEKIYLVDYAVVMHDARIIVADRIGTKGDDGKFHFQWKKKNGKVLNEEDVYYYFRLDE